MASNVRFLDQISIAAFADTTPTVVSAANKRFILAGETVTVAATDQIVAYDLFNFGTINIEQGTQIPIGNGAFISTDGLYQIQTILTNEGIINNNGILVIDSNIYT
jgi:hypothetical protein